MYQSEIVYTGIINYFISILSASLIQSIHSISRSNPSIHSIFMSRCLVLLSKVYILKDTRKGTNYCTVKIHRFSSSCPVCGRRCRHKTGGGGRHAGRKKQISPRIRKSSFRGEFPPTAAATHPHPSQPDPGSPDPAAYTATVSANDFSATDHPTGTATPGASGGYTAAANPDSPKLQTPAAQIHYAAGLHAVAQDARPVQPLGRSGGSAPVPA
jgi:hypothetical protein